MVAVKKIEMRHCHTYLMLRQRSICLRHLPRHFAFMRLLGSQGHGICRIEASLGRYYINSRFTHARYLPNHFNHTLTMVRMRFHDEISDMSWNRKDAGYERFCLETNLKMSLGICSMPLCHQSLSSPPRLGRARGAHILSWRSYAEEDSRSK